MGLRDTDWLCSLIGWSQNMIDYSSLRTARFWGQLPRRDGVFEIVYVEGRASEPVREGRKEKGRGTQREKENRSM